MDESSTTEELVSRKDSRLPVKLSALRRRLGQKAKQEPKFRFYALYDRIYREDTLRTAWDIVRRGGEAPGIDGVKITAIAKSEDRIQTLLSELHHELRTKTYRPQPVRRVYIPKTNGKQRPSSRASGASSSSTGRSASPHTPFSAFGRLRCRVPPA